MKRRKVIIACLALLILLAGCTQTVNQKNEVSIREPDVLKPVRVSAENRDAAEPALATGGDGTAYVVWVEHQQNKEADVMFAHLDRDGQVLGAPVRVNPKPGEATAWRGDPPTVVVAPDKTVYVGWTARLASEEHGNELYLSASRDGGQSFEPPVKVNDDGKAVGHGMHSLAVGEDGRVYVAWLDERNARKTMAMGQTGAMLKMEHMESNREVFMAFSTNGGRSFSKNQRIAQEACPCCKTALAAGANGRVYAGWRQVLPGEFRHIAVAASEDGGKTFQSPRIVSDDRWMIAACPVSGPALSVADNGALQVVWYTEGERATPGLYSAESLDNGKTFSESRPLARGQGRGTPLLLAGGKSGALVVWESNEGGESRVVSVPLYNDEKTANAAPVASGGELPSAAVSGDQLFVGYIARTNERRSIWIVRAKAVA
ncbi:MAG: hypothetical protein QOJ02_3976 [Acidobacteriota bacterium]|jgi:hypothetical protein|nr:hypothetical protein [Acidobacteriota bacterium]